MTSMTDGDPSDPLSGEGRPLKKRGYSLTGLSVANGYYPTAAGKALKAPWRAMEVIVAVVATVAAIWLVLLGLLLLLGWPGAFTNH